MRIDRSTIANHFVPRHCHWNLLTSCQLNKAGPFFTWLEHSTVYSTSLKWQNEPWITYVSHSHLLYFMWLCWSHLIELRTHLDLENLSLFPSVTKWKDNSVISDMHLYEQTCLIQTSNSEKENETRAFYFLFIFSLSLFPSFSNVC